MVKVLAAELSDGARLSRGKQYFSDGAVTDIEVEPGLVTVEVQGSRSSPYHVSVRTRPGSGVPSRSEVSIFCTCPDSDRSPVCKHGVAALFALANEVSIEPDFLNKWRDDSADAELAPVINLFKNGRHRSNSADAGDAVDHAARATPDAADVAVEPEIELQDADDDSAEVAMINAMLNGAHQHHSVDIDNSDHDRNGDHRTARDDSEFHSVVPVPHPPSGDPMIDRLLQEIFDELHLGWH